MSKVIEDMLIENVRETRIHDIQKMMKKLSISVEQALDILDIPVSERDIYTGRICQEQV